MRAHRHTHIKMIFFLWRFIVDFADEMMWRLSEPDFWRLHAWVECLIQAKRRSKMLKHSEDCEILELRKRDARLLWEYWPCQNWHKIKVQLYLVVELCNGCCSSDKWFSEINRSVHSLCAQIERAHFVTHSSPQRPSSSLKCQPLRARKKNPQKRWIMNWAR